MAEDSAPAVASPAAPKSPKKKNKGSKSKKPANHPKYSEMIKAAISSLKERGGSSRQAIFKYIKANYNVGNDDKVINSHLKMALRAGAKNGNLKQSKGTGASGSFKLGEKPKVAAKAKPAKAKAKSPKKTTKPKAAKAKSPAKAKKTSTKKPAAAAKKSKPATPTKKSATAKSATKKKSPKKKATSPKKAKGAGKKAAAAKK